MNTAMGVNKPKKIIPSTIGLTIMPSRSPKRIHSLFRGRSASLFTSVTTRKIAAIEKSTYAQFITADWYKYAAATANTNAKKNPNFRLDGSLISEKFIFCPSQLYECEVIG
tara:strand:+ start:175 stop:507 length:333 start_codon:yes stop_codon:yes gene_type:complete